MLHLVCKFKEILPYQSKSEREFQHGKLLTQISNALSSLWSFDSLGSRAFAGIFQGGSIHKCSCDSIENKGLTWRPRDGEIPLHGLAYPLVSSFISMDSMSTFAIMGKSCLAEAARGRAERRLSFYVGGGVYTLLVRHKYACITPWAMVFVSLVFIPTESYLQGHWSPFHFTYLLLLLFLNLVYTPLPWSLCTNGTLQWLVEYGLPALTLGTSFWVAGIGREETSLISGGHLLPLGVRSARAGTDIGTQSKWPSQPTSHQVTSWISSPNTYRASAISGTATDTQRVEDNRACPLPSKEKFCFNKLFRRG